MAKWNTHDIPDQSGRVALITGANSGLGLETAKALAGKGARVVLACRSREKAEGARDMILGDCANASLEIMELDLASLASVRAFADAFSAANDRLDVLCNNAGVMAIPYRKTADGFEMQIGTNHLGHFALTGLLVELLLATPTSRIVNVSSNAHHVGRIRFHDLHWERGYKKWLAYGQSKLANILFSLELQRRLEAKGVDTLAVSCHPGYAATNLQVVGPQMVNSNLLVTLAGWANKVFAQSAEMGALTNLYAATEPTVAGASYIGPGGRLQQSGYPEPVSPNSRALDGETARKLWDLSIEQTGIDFAALA